MKLQLFKTLWGHAGSFEDAAIDAVEAGFAGLEGPYPLDDSRRRELDEALSTHNLKFIAEVSATGYANPETGASVDAQLDSFERLLAHSLQGQPLLVTTMAGSDLWSHDESVQFLARANEIATSCGVAVGFETHRSRSLHHPIITGQLLAKLPDIRLTVDFSHWCVACERLVMDELPDLLELCAARVLHIHGRIGYDQGAQVPDPRAPKFAKAVDAHLRWWRSLWNGQRRRGLEFSTFTPEFGPDGYLQTDPWSDEPVADLRELNQHIANVVSAEYSLLEPLREGALR
jgi:hypothetical protein